MLFRLLAAPVTGPLLAIRAVADHAMDTYYDPQAVIAEFENLRQMRKSNSIGEDDYAEQAAALNERFLIAQARSAKKPT